MQYVTIDNDTLDAICYKVYKNNCMVPQIYTSNPGLCEMPLIFKAGIIINLPRHKDNFTMQNAKTLNIWD